MTRCPWKLAAGGALLAATTAALATPTARLASLPRESACYPEQEINVAVDHAFHLEMGISCTDCHTLATTSRSAADNLVPAEAVCGECHYETMVERGVIATRQLAKRQLTWLRSEPWIHWLYDEAGDPGPAALEMVRYWLRKGLNPFY